MESHSTGPPSSTINFITLPTEICLLVYEQLVGALLDYIHVPSDLKWPHGVPQLDATKPWCKCPNARSLPHSRYVYRRSSCASRSHLPCLKARFDRPSPNSSSEQANTCRSTPFPLLRSRIPILTSLSPNFQQRRLLLPHHSAMLYPILPTGTRPRDQVDRYHRRLSLCRVPWRPSPILRRLLQMSLSRTLTPRTLTVIGELLSIRTYDRPSKTTEKCTRMGFHGTICL
jgi:hypothetical protein